MEQWQMWSLRRTENPRELDRNQPAPLHGDDSSAGQNAGLWIRRSRVRSPFFTPTYALLMELVDIPHSDRGANKRVSSSLTGGTTQGIGAMVSAEVLYT